MHTAWVCVVCACVRDHVTSTAIYARTLYTTIAVFNFKYIVLIDYMLL